jgi:hypothetical protein
MINELFVILLATLFGASFTRAFRTPTQEKWQIIAAVPEAMETEGVWRGLNLTYHGFFQATSNSLMGVMMLILLGAIGIPDASAVADEILVKDRVERDGEFAGEVESAVEFSVEFAGESASEIQPRYRFRACAVTLQISRVLEIAAAAACH